MSRIEKILQSMIDNTSYDEEPCSRIEAILLAIKNNTEYSDLPYSRIEELLLAIKNGATYDREAQSRIEEILLATLNGIEYGKKPYSKIEALLLHLKGEAEIRELEDMPPLIFNSTGIDLLDYRIYGAGGGVGDKTKNLLQYPFVFTDEYTSYGVTFQVNSNKSITVSGENTGTRLSYYAFSPWWTNYTYERIPLLAGQTVTFSCKGLPSDWNMMIGFCSSQTGEFNRIAPTVYISGENAYTYTAEEDCYIIFGIRQNSADSQVGFTCYPQIELGESATDFESPGIYKIPVICGGQTTNIYLNEPLETGESISMNDTNISIPTVDGKNTLSVDTEIQPEKIYVKYFTWMDYTDGLRLRTKRRHINDSFRTPFLQL